MSVEVIEARIAAARALLRAARHIAAPPIRNDAELRAEARRILPTLEAVAGRPYGRLPAISFRRGVEARLAGPWSQYLTLGLGVTRLVRMCPLALHRPGLPTVLAHELAHRYAFDESLTTLRGLETSARLGRSDPRHAASARLELARILLRSALEQARRSGHHARVDALLAGDDAVLASMRAHWTPLRARPQAAPPDWALTVYQRLPVEALEQAADAGIGQAPEIPLPRFALDSVQAALAWTYTRADALTGRRAARVPVEASLELLVAARSDTV